MPREREQQFLLFGMGPSRRKLVYVPGGRLMDALSLEPVRTWDIEAETFGPAEYRVVMRLRDRNEATVFEDGDGVWVEQAGDRELLTKGEEINLPRFGNHPHAAWLRALHAELLVNIMPSGPVPNLWVYPRPWYRDAAMMLMCFEKTRNLHLVEPWVTGLHQVWDRNNNGEAEADNLGQVLYMAAVVSATKHPLIEEVLKAVPDYRKDNHIIGRTDFQEHPVYQTKWLKYGLRALGLDDPYHIPEVQDSYSSLFWMDYRDEHVSGERFGERALELYPYLNWAEAHFYDEPFPEPLGELRPPLTREGRGSQADYRRLKPLAEYGAIPPEQAAAHTATPHTWHAAEMFLYLAGKSRDDTEKSLRWRNTCIRSRR